MKFDKELLLEKLEDNIEDEITDQGRWETHRRMVFEHEGKFYESFYSCGSTEYQETYPYENDDNVIECDEVFKTEKTITVYLKNDEIQRNGKRNENE